MLVLDTKNPFLKAFDFAMLSRLDLEFFFFSKYDGKKLKK